MSVHKDRDYYRLKYMEGQKVVDKYYGKDRLAALKDAVIIIDIKLRRWQKRRDEYLQEIESLLANPIKETSDLTEPETELD